MATATGRQEREEARREETREEWYLSGRSGDAAKAAEGGSL